MEDRTRSFPVTFWEEVMMKLDLNLDFKNRLKRQNKTKQKTVFNTKSKLRNIYSVPSI